jgi:hypothetical protein
MWSGKKSKRADAIDNAVDDDDATVSGGHWRLWVINSHRIT